MQKEVMITIVANVEESDLEEVMRLSHHAEGIFEEYPELKDAIVTVKVLS